MTREGGIAKELQIDEVNLDVEWHDHHNRAFKYGVKYADAKLDVSECKSALEVVKAELRHDMTKAPDKYDLSKTTDKAIDAAICQHQKFLAAQADLFAAQRDADVYEAAVKAFVDRKKALENLVELHQTNYRGDPKATLRSKDQVEEAEKRSVRKGGIKKQRKSKKSE